MKIETPQLTAAKKSNLLSPLRWSLQTWQPDNSSGPEHCKVVIFVSQILSVYGKQICLFRLVHKSRKLNWVNADVIRSSFPCTRKLKHSYRSIRKSKNGNYNFSVSGKNEVHLIFLMSGAIASFHLHFCTFWGRTYCLQSHSALHRFSPMEQSSWLRVSSKSTTIAQ